MTKFIFHGGGASIESKNNDLFYYEILKDLPEQSTLLLVYLARFENLWDTEYQKDKAKFTSVAGGKKIRFVIADKQTDKLTQQIKSSCAIYIRGGDVAMIRSYLDKVDNLKDLLKSKIIAGSSAGACILARYYYSNDNDRIEKGMGILPIKIYCHYNKSKKENLVKLKNFKEKLRTLPIEEATFVILNKKF